jgi:phenylacetate-CoA ligase
MSTPGRFLFQVTQRLRRSGTLKILEAIRSEPDQPRPQILEHQFLRLSRLLATAEAHVPYYREMFRSLGIHSHDIRNLDDFASLPVLTKDIIRERQDDLLREDVPKEKLIVGNSGGSTGVPLRFYRSRADLDACDAGTFRNCLQSGWKPSDMVAFIWGFNPQLWEMPAWEFELRQHLRRMYQFDPFHSSAEQMERWLAKWKRIRPRVVIGYASSVARFAEHVEGTGKQVDPLLGAFTTAEKLYPAQREAISRVFGCPVYDMYGSSEVNNIACTCSLGRMHVSADCVVLEVDRKQGLPGLPPPFIVTSLWNEVMPFIRYRNEDCGELLEGFCDCGNQFPLMELNISRVSDNFTLPSGEVVHGEFFTHLMYGSKGIAMFQFHQTALDSITLWIVPKSGHAAAREEAIRLVVEQVEELDATRTLRIQVQETEAIPLSRNGKHRFTISDVRAVSTSGSLPSDVESELA